MRCLIKTCRVVLASFLVLTLCLWSVPGAYCLAPDTKSAVQEAHIAVLTRLLLEKIRDKKNIGVLEWSQFHKAAIVFLRDTPRLSVYVDKMGSIVLYDPDDTGGNIHRFVSVDQPELGSSYDPLKPVLDRLILVDDHPLAEKYGLRSYRKLANLKGVWPGESRPDISDAIKKELQGKLTLMLPSLNTLNPQALAFRSKEEFMDFAQGYFEDIPAPDMANADGSEEKAYKRLADTHDAYPEPLEGGVTVPLATEEELGHWVEDAEKMYLDGLVVNHLLWAGAATRAAEILGGGSKALFNPVVDVLSKPQDYLDTIAPDEKNPLKNLLANGAAQVRMPVALGPRQIMQYRIELERLATKHRRNIQEVLANQKFIVAVNDKTRDIIVQTFRDAGFFGFDPKHVIFVEQPTFPAFRHDGTRWVPVDGSAYPFGHGHTCMQKTMPRSGFIVDPYNSGKQIPLDPAPLKYFKNMAGGKKLIGNNWNIDDLVRLGGEYKGAALKNLDARRAAMALKIISEEGKHVVVETVINEKGQKGGGWFTPGILVEGLQLQTGPNADVDFKKVNLNRMANWEDVDALLEYLPEQGLPLYLVPKKFNGQDVMILESITGDETRVDGIKPEAFSERGATILTFKKVVDTVITMERMLSQDNDPAFVAMAAIIYPELVAKLDLSPRAPPTVAGGNSTLLSRQLLDFQHHRSMEALGHIASAISTANDEALMKTALSGWVLGPAGDNGNVPVVLAGVAKGLRDATPEARRLFFSTLQGMPIDRLPGAQQPLAQLLLQIHKAIESRSDVIVDTNVATQGMRYLLGGKEESIAFPIPVASHFAGPEANAARAVEIPAAAASEIEILNFLTESMLAKLLNEVDVFSRDFASAARVNDLVGTPVEFDLLAQDVQFNADGTLKSFRYTGRGLKKILEGLPASVRLPVFGAQRAAVMRQILAGGEALSDADFAKIQFIESEDMGTVITEAGLASAPVQKVRWLLRHRANPAGTVVEQVENAGYNYLLAEPGISLLRMMTFILSVQDLRDSSAYQALINRMTASFMSVPEMQAAGLIPDAGNPFLLPPAQQVRGISSEIEEMRISSQVKRSA